MTLEPVLRLLRPGPKLVGGNFVQVIRKALGGPDLQILGVRIYNERESGGEPKTARAVVPRLEAFDLSGQSVKETLGVWFHDKTGLVPDTVDFRPTREEHTVELVAKFPDGEDAWLSGQEDPPSLKPGTYEIRLTLRGDNLKKPARLKFFVWNPGRNGRLAVARSVAELPRDLPPAALVPTAPVPTPLDEAELDCWVMSGSSAIEHRFKVENTGEVPLERIEWIFPPESGNWQVFPDSVTTYPIPRLDPGDAVIARMVVGMGPHVIEVTLSGWVNDVQYTRKRTLNILAPSD